MGVHEMKMEATLGMADISSRADVETAMKTGETINLQCTRCSLDGTLMVIDSDKTGYRIPLRETMRLPGDRYPSREIAKKMVGRVLRVKVHENLDGESSKNGEVHKSWTGTPLDNHVAVSRRECQQEALEHISNNWKLGEIHRCCVTGVGRHGLFVDVGEGFTGLVPEVRISYSHRERRAYDFKIGDTIECLFYRLDGDRVFMSMRELLGDWVENASKFEVGDTVVGVASGMKNGGLFVELTPNLRGLADIAEGKQDEYKDGQRVSVSIQVIDYQREKIKLAVEGKVDGTVGEALSSSEYYQYFLSGYEAGVPESDILAVNKGPMHRRTGSTGPSEEPDDKLVAHRTHREKE